METNIYTETCSVCGVVANSNHTVFKFSSGKVVTPDMVYSRVCQYAPETKRPNCMNNTGKYVESEGWLCLDEE